MKILMLGKFSNSWGIEPLWKKALENAGAEVWGLESGQTGATFIFPDAYKGFDATIGFQAPAVEEWMPSPRILLHGELLPHALPTSDGVALTKWKNLRETLHNWDLVLNGDAAAVPLLTDAGVRAEWHPTALVDPEVHKPPDIRDGSKFDLLFYGTASPRRVAVVSRLFDYLAGKGYRVTWEAGWGYEMIRLIQQTKVVLNIHFTGTLNVETRIFEAIGCGRPVLTDPLSMPNLFPGSFVRQVSLDSAPREEIEEQVSLLVRHHRILGAEAREHALKNYTYEKGAKALIALAAVMGLANKGAPV